MPRRSGVEFQPSKTRAWCRRVRPALPGVAELGADVRRSDREPAERGLRVVGTPVGTSEYFAAFLEQRLQTQRALIDVLPRIGDPQSTWLMLRL